MTRNNPLIPVGKRGFVPSPTFRCGRGTGEGHDRPQARSNALAHKEIARYVTSLEARLDPHPNPIPGQGEGISQILAGNPVIVLKVQTVVRISLVKEREPDLDRGAHKEKQAESILL